LPRKEKEDHREPNRENRRAGVRQNEGKKKELIFRSPPKEKKSSFLRALSTGSVNGSPYIIKILFHVSRHDLDYHKKGGFLINMLDPPGTVLSLTFIGDRKKAYYKKASSIRLTTWMGVFGPLLKRCAMGWSL